MHRDTLYFVYANGATGPEYLGQAAHAMGEVNAYRINTKKVGNCNEDRAFLKDSEYDMNVRGFQLLLSLIPTDRPIVVFRKIGEGCSKLKERAPKTFETMCELLAKICWKEIEWKA